MLGPLSLLLVILSATPGETLRQRLELGEPCSVVVLGDSITAGMHLPDPATESYGALFAELLRARWPAMRFELHRRGTLGAASGAAVDGWADEVPPLGPQLVVIQFGGNDKGTGDGAANLPTYQANLATLIDLAHAAGAACLLVAPPIHERPLDSPFPAAARAVGRAAGVPVADFDTAIKRGSHDYRGLFPYFIHPREHEHALAAVELWRALGELLGEPASLEARFLPVATVALPGGRLTLPVEVSNLGVKPLDLLAAIDGLGDLPAQRLEPGASARWAAATTLAHSLPGGRSSEQPLRLAVRGGGWLAPAYARLVAAPIVNVPALGSAGASSPVVRLGPHSMIVGESLDLPASDCAAELYLAADNDRLRLRVAVTDDDIGTSGAPLGDGVELYLDLRGDSERGQPWYSEQVASLMFSVPATSGAVPARTLNEDHPPAGLLQLSAQVERVAGGYRLTLDLPRPLLDQIAGRRVTALGFDVAVDDADGGQRQTQLMWLGRADNYINPRCLGELRLDDPAPLGALRVTVF
ncbi:MAG: hypothetical protein IT204_24240 [Fimbriimonadaceae bacterium]|nr:hypothetical protein [Fimbriimonadaceae bacterium]